MSSAEICGSRDKKMNQSVLTHVTGFVLTSRHERRGDCTGGMYNWRGFVTHWEGAHEKLMITQTEGLWYG